MHCNPAIHLGFYVLHQFEFSLFIIVYITLNARVEAAHALFILILTNPYEFQPISILSILIGIGACPPLISLCA